MLKKINSFFHFFIQKKRKGTNWAHGKVGKKAFGGCGLINRIVDL